MSYILKALIQNKYWNPNSMGYTGDIDSAGKFSYETAYDYCRWSNTNGKINLVMNNEEDIDAIKNGEIVLPSSQQEKKPIEEVLAELGNTNSLENNPISLIFETLNKHHYYPEENHDQLKYFGQPINYGETFEENLKIYGEVDNQKDRSPLFVKMSIYRKENGLYEMTAYSNYGEPENKIKRKSRMRP